jgi:hypothetical protein
MALSKIGSNQIDTAATPTVAGATVTGNLDVDGTTTLDGLTSSEAVKVADGTASAPSIVFNSDTNTGIYKNANDKLGFVTGGTERMRITDLGRIEFQTPTNQTGTLQDQRLDWRNENNAGIMASIAVHREANGNAPSALVFRTSTNVDSASNSSDGEISEKMRISSGGIVTMPNQPAFFGYKSGGGNSTAANGAGVIDTVGTDVGNNFNTSNGRFTCPVAGRYLVTWTMMNHQSNTGTSTAKFRWNSTPYKYFHVENGHPQGQSDQVIVNASANDFFDLDITHFHFNGGSQYKYPSMCVVLIG